MKKNPQLYKETTFSLPKMPHIDYAPFSHHKNCNQANTEHTILSQIVPEVKPTYQLAYNGEFEIIIGGQNMYPLFMDANEDHLVVCAHDFFLVVKIDVCEDAQKKQNQTEGSLKSTVKLGIYNKVILSEAPSCMFAARHHVYLGMSDGKILCYDIGRKALTGTCDAFAFPIMQIMGVGENQVVAIDCAGNVRWVEYSHKSFMDKIIKTLVNTKEISVQYKTNKREKIKKFFSRAIHKKDEASYKKSQNKTEASHSGANNQSQDKSQSPPKTHEQNPYFSTCIQLPSQQLKQLLIENIRIMAVVRKEKLSIISCNSDYEFIQEQCILQNPHEVGMLEFGVGGFENSNNTHLLLVFSLGMKLFYYKGVETEDSYEWLFISETHFPDNIVDGKFISNNLLVVLTQSQVTICNVSENPQAIHPFLISKFSYIDFFIHEEGLHFDKNLVRKFMLRTITNRNEFFCLQGKRLLTGKIDSWKEYVQRYVDEEKFAQAICMSLQIYNRHMKLLCNINEKQETRNQEMKQFFEKIALTYLSYEIKRQNFDQTQLLEFCVHYLIKTECFQYLFTTIYQILASLNLQDAFLEKIDQYAMQGEVKVMTEQILEKMVSWYKNKSAKDKLQIMVMGFDLSLMDKSLLLILCLKEHLYQSMIYICSQHGDFISPILKLCGIFFTQNLSPQDKQNIKEIMFFYLKECLLGHTTEYGNSKAYIEMLIQVINFVFIPSTLDMLVGISSGDTIKVINMFFETKILQYILENEGQFFIKKNEYVEMKVFENACINEFKVYEKMLSTLIYILDQSLSKGKKNQQMMPNEQSGKNHHESNESNESKVSAESLYFEVNSFLSYLILKNQFPFEAKYKISSVEFFIDTLSVKFQQLFIDESDSAAIGSSIIFREKSRKEKRLKEGKQEKLWEKEVEVNAYFMRLMDSLLRSLEANEEEGMKTLNAILAKLEASQDNAHLLEGKCYLLNELGREAEALKTYLSMKNPMLKNKVFEYLDFNLHQTPALRQQFINSLDSLFSLHKQKTQSLLTSLHLQSTDIDDIILNLHSYPELQLQYLEQILHSSIPLPESKKHKYALIHLQIVVKHHSAKLDEYIQKIEYPLEEALKICEDKNNKTAKAYIMIKSGRNLKGLLELCDVFLTHCDVLFGNIARKRLVDNESVTALSQQLDKLLLACQKEYEMDSEKGETIWQKCIKKIFRHLRIAQNIKNQAIPQQIKSIFKQIVDKTMKTMFSQLSTDFFVEKFCKKFPHLPFSVFIVAFGQVFDRMEFNSELQLLELELQQRDESKIKKNLLKYSLKSHPVWSECSSCGENLSSSDAGEWNVITHSCGCNFHKGCLDAKADGEGQKKKEMLGVVHLCMNEIESFVERKGIKIQHFRTDQFQQTAIKKKAVKLHEYESNQVHVFDLPAAFV